MFTYFTINLMLLTSSVTPVTPLIVYLTQTSSDFEQDIIDDVIDLTRGTTISDHVCMLMADTSSTCSEMNFHFMWFIRTFLYCQCNLMHLMAIM